MRLLNWLYIGLVAMIVLASIINGFAGPLFIACSAIALTLPPLWDRLKQRTDDTWPKARGFASIILGLTALIVWGNEFEKTPEGKAARVEREQQKHDEAQQEQAKVASKAAVAQETSRKGFDCLSSWDGSHRALVNTVEQQLRNPGSFEHIETSITPVDENGQHRVMMKYRAENGFGGMNVEAVSAVIDHDSCDLLQVGS